MGNAEKGRGWLKWLPWGLISIAVVIICRHFLIDGSIDNVSTLEWIVAIMSAVAGEVMLWMPKKRKQVEN